MVSDWNDLSHCFVHFFLKLTQPNLHIVLCCHNALEVHFFFLWTDHALNCVSLIGRLSSHHVKLYQSLKTLTEILFNHLKVTWFWEDFKKFVIGQKVKPGEDLSFAFKILLKFFLDFFEHFDIFIEFIQGWRRFGDFVNFGRHLEFIYMGFNESIASIKITWLKGHLLLDIRSRKDILKIHPFFLGFNPSLNDFHDKLNLLGEFFSPASDRFYVSVGKRVVDIRKGFVENDSQLINLTQNISRAVLVRFNTQVSSFENIFNLRQRLLELSLLVSFGRDFNQIASNSFDVQFEKTLECDRFIQWVELGLEDSWNFLDVVWL